MLSYNINKNREKHRKGGSRISFRRNKMKGTTTVLGKDQVGIIAKTCTYLAKENVNVLDISQTITQGNFHMIMIVDTSGAEAKFETLIEALETLGKEIGVIITLQNEEIFNAMHRI